MKKRYRAEARRVGKWWAIDVSGVRGAHTQARRLDQAEAMAREVISILRAVDPASFEVEVVPILDPELRTVVEDVRERREAADRAQHEAGQTMRDAVRHLSGRGLSTRDIGALLGVTNQRISQVARSAR